MPGENWLHSYCERAVSFPLNGVFVSPCHSLHALGLFSLSWVYFIAFIVSIVIILVTATRAIIIKKSRVGFGTICLTGGLLEIKYWSFWHWGGPLWFIRHLYSYASPRLAIVWKMFCLLTFKPPSTLLLRPFH